MTKLYLVSIDIGNREDITLRALNILKNVDNLVCEEYKIGKRVMRAYDLGEKNLLQLNEHSKDEDVDELISDYLLKGKDLALFSDTGTPVFADPGFKLSQRAYNLGIEVVPIPGASSLMAAIVKSDIEMKKFYFYGFVSPKKDIREKELLKLKHFPNPIIFLEAPYRLKQLLTAIKKSMGPKRYINIILELTTKNEKIVRGNIKDVLSYFEKKPFKGEFVIILDSK